MLNFRGIKSKWYKHLLDYYYFICIWRNGRRDSQPYPAKSWVQLRCICTDWTTDWLANRLTHCQLYGWINLRIESIHFHLECEEIRKIIFWFIFLLCMFNRKWLYAFIVIATLTEFNVREFVFLFIFMDLPSTSAVRINRYAARWFII